LIVTGAANIFLVAGAAGSFAAALAHVGCIVFGAQWYRFFGAGEKMARMAEARSLTPTLITGGIVLVLLAWSYIALAGAGLVPKPPLLRALLAGVTAVYLLRGLMLVPMMNRMTGRSLTFWLWSSAICLALGALHLAGTHQTWSSL
jgi:hypothetical protein